VCPPLLLDELFEQRRDANARSVLTH
jgi:hypothetical protein